MQYKGWITIPSNPDYHPIMQTDPCVSSNAPSLGSHGEPSHPLYDIVFSWGGVGGASSWGVHKPWRRDLTICRWKIYDEILPFIHIQIEATKNGVHNILWNESQDYDFEITATSPMCQKQICYLYCSNAHILICCLLDITRAISPKCLQSTHH